MSSAAPEPGSQRVWRYSEGCHDDILLEVGPKRIPCIVSLQALRNASTVFAQLLPEVSLGNGYGAFYGAATAERKFRLEDTNFNGLDMLFTIIHRHWSVPLQLQISNHEEFLDLSSGPPWSPNREWRDVDLLLSIALAADKYCLTHILQPFAELWLFGFRVGFHSLGIASRELLWAAWLLGDEMLFRGQLDDFATRIMWKEHQPDQYYVHGIFDEDESFESLDIAGVAFRDQTTDVSDLWRMSSSLDTASMTSVLIWLCG